MYRRSQQMVPRLSLLLQWILTPLTRESYRKDSNEWRNGERTLQFPRSTSATWQRQIIGQSLRLHIQEATSSGPLKHLVCWAHSRQSRGTTEVLLSVLQPVHLPSHRSTPLNGHFSKVGPVYLRTIRFLLTMRMKSVSSKALWSRSSTSQMVLHVQMRTHNSSIPEIARTTAYSPFLVPSPAMPILTSLPCLDG